MNDDDQRGIDVDDASWTQRIKSAQRDAVGTAATGNLAAAIWSGAYARDVAALVRIVTAYEQRCEDGDT